MKLSKYLALLLAATLLCSLCGLGAAEAAPDKVVIWTDASGDNIADWNSNAILQAIEQATNTDIEIVVVDNSTKMDLLNAAIASGTLPDIMPILGPEFRGVLESWIADGVLAAYEGDVAAAAPNVVKEYEVNQLLAELKVNDKIYFQPGYWGFDFYPNGGLLYVREDLVKAYDLKIPTNFDEYFTYLETCIAKGYEGVTFSGASGVGNALSAFVGAYGTPNLGWVKAGDGYQFWALQEGALNGLLLFRQMNQRGLVNPASWEADDDMNRSAFVSGTACSSIYWGGGHIGRIQNDMALVNPDFQAYLLAAPDNGGESRGYTSEGMYWGYGCIGGMSNNNPVAAARVINYLISDEGVKLTVLGVEGRDYEEVDGKYVLNHDNRTLDVFPTEAGETGAHPLATNLVSWVPQEWQNWQLLYGNEKSFEDWFYAQWANQGMYQIPSYGQAITTPAWASFQNTSNELVSRYFVDIVKSATDEEAKAKYEEFKSAWYATGGTAAEAEMSVLLAKLYN